MSTLSLSTTHGTCQGSFLVIERVNKLENESYLSLADLARRPDSFLKYSSSTANLRIYKEKYELLK